jgi:hypothetical protein
LLAKNKVSTILVSRPVTLSCDWQGVKPCALLAF